MRNYRVQIWIVFLAVCTVIITAPFFGAAQQLPKSNLRETSRETPKEETRALVPVSRTTINVDLWLNKACGSPFYTREKALIYFKTDVDGYVTLYDIDTQGNVLVIFPNRHTPDNAIKAGQRFQIPAQEADYDLIVEGPEGIEYIEAVASTDPYYHWNYHQGEPRWLKELNLKGRKGQEYEVRDMDQSTAAAYKESTEYQNLPKEFGATGLKSLTRNFQLSQNLREEVRSSLVVRPREQGSGQGTVELVSEQQVQDYSTASCYFYVVVGSPGASAQPISSPGEDYLRQQERDFQRIPGFEVQRDEHRLIVAMPNRVLFDSGSYSLRYEARQDLNQVTQILLRYPNTDVVVIGHTDSKGSEDYNQRLSEFRARAVADYLIDQGVKPYRISWTGFGETMPIATNDTESGRQRNRRVELDIRFNEQYGQ